LTVFASSCGPSYFNQLRCNSVDAVNILLMRSSNERQLYSNFENFLSNIKWK